MKSICSFSRQPKSFCMEECLEIKVLPKVAFFAWTATRGKILQRVIVVINRFMLLSGALFARIVVILRIICFCIMSFLSSFGPWCFVFFSLHWTMPRRVVDLLVCWKGPLDWHKNAIVWNATPLCIMWTTWEERNSHLFEGIEHSLLDLKFILLCTLYEWMAIWSCHSCFTI